METSGTEPGAAGVGVTPADLRADAEVWREQGAALAGIGDAIRGLAAVPGKLGIFGLIAPPHDSLASKLSGTCAASGARTEHVGAWLHESAGKYENTDEDVAHGITEAGRSVEGGRS